MAKESQQTSSGMGRRPIQWDSKELLIEISIKIFKNMVHKDTNCIVGFSTLTGSIEVLSTIGMDFSTSRRHLFSTSHGDS